MKITIGHLRSLIVEAAVKPNPKKGYTDHMETNKWKVPEWLKPGVRVRVVKGRKFPVGLTGVVYSTGTTGSGAYVYFLPDGSSVDDPMSFVTISVLNVELAP